MTPAAWDALWRTYIAGLKACDAHAAREASATRSRNTYARWKREAKEHRARARAAWAKVYEADPRLAQAVGSDPVHA